jgi:hypothetical protein
MCLAHDAYDDGSLLDSLLCILDLEYAALWREGDRVVVVVVAKHGGGERGGAAGAGWGCWSWAEVGVGVERLGGGRPTKEDAAEAVGVDGQLGDFGGLVGLGQLLVLQAIAHLRQLRA